jgi:hypothetical protein
MKMKVILLAILLIVVCLALPAVKLKYDANGIPIQMSRYFTAVRDTIPAQAPAVYDSIAVPVNTSAVTIIGSNATLMIYAGQAKTLTAADWIFIPKDVPITLPCMDVITYIKYKSYTGAAAINIIWQRM